MSFTTSNPTQFFSVVGPAFVAECHGGMSHLPAQSETRQLQLGVTGLWVSLFVSIGFSLVGSNHAAKAIQLATSGMH